MQISVIECGLNIWFLASFMPTSTFTVFIRFRGKRHKLMYCSYRRLSFHTGLVGDLGHHRDGFQDIQVHQHLCAKVTSYWGKVHFVDESGVTEDRVWEALL